MGDPKEFEVHGQLPAEVLMGDGLENWPDGTLDLAHGWNQVSWPSPSDLPSRGSGTSTLGSELLGTGLHRAETEAFS